MLETTKAKRIRRHKININEQVFDNLTPENAYWLGFLYADGNLYTIQLKTKETYRVTFCLAAKDSIAVKAFMRFLEADGGLYFRPKTKALSFSVTNQYLGERLKELGIEDRKSAKIRYPKIISELGLDAPFIRGYIDGDGWIGVYKRGEKDKTPCIGIASNRDFLMGVGEVIEKELEIPIPTFSPHKEDKGGTIRGREVKARDPYFGIIMFRSTWENTKKFCDWLTADGGFYFHRKIGKFYEAYHEYYLGNGKQYGKIDRILKGYEYELDAEHQKLVVQHYLEGMYWVRPYVELKALAGSFGVSYEVLINTLKKHKVYRERDEDYTYRKCTEEDIEAVVFAYTSGTPMADIAGRYQINRATVLTYVKNAGIKVARAGRNIRNITYNGKTQSVTEWAKELGVKRHMLFNRLGKGWDVGRVLTQKLPKRLSDETVKDIRTSTDTSNTLALKHEVSVTVIRDVKVGIRYKNTYPELICEQQQPRNLTAKGKTQYLAAWERETGIKAHTINSRIKRGWTVEEALGFTERLPPPCFKRKLWESGLEYNGEVKSMAEWAEVLNVQPQAIYQRLLKGWTVEEAVTVKKGQRLNDFQEDLEIKKKRQKLREELHKVT